MSIEKLCPSFTLTEDRLRRGLVRETKGSEDTSSLRFPGEERKVDCARKHFRAIGIDYRVVDDKTVDWWEAEVRQERWRS